jgi:NAD(P)-dependent dehydrogenase (short-subunit alcohol dehydrogenase family)
MAAGSGKVAFVTGAASGIGKATATAFARAGYAVALVDLDTAAGEALTVRLQAEGASAKFFTANTADDKQVRAAVEGTIAAFGRLDAAFNAAGISGEGGKMAADCTPENWARVLQIDLTGVWYCMRHQIPAMLASGGGAIVNCASTAGVTGAPMFAAYCAAKHGVVGLTKSASLDYARQNIRVNAVAPGMIDTPMNAELPRDLLQGLLDESPTGRLGKPEEIADAVLYLCSDGAGFITGQTLPVDGAWTTR